MSLREDLRDVVRLMVDRDDEVEVDEERHDGTTVLSLRVAEEDLGKVIGRQGRTARALRRVLAARVEPGQGAIDLKIED